MVRQRLMSEVRYVLLILLCKYGVNCTASIIIVFNLSWLDIVITRTMLKNRELKTGWPFLRAGRGNWLTKWKELPKWPDVSSCSRHITPWRVIRISILEKQCAISLYFVWWPMFKFFMLYCTAKNFHYTKNKKIL
jgi:hypothetical protein